MSRLESSDIKIFTVFASSLVYLPARNLVVKYHRPLRCKFRQLSFTLASPEVSSRLPDSLHGANCIELLLIVYLETVGYGESSYTY